MDDNAILIIKTLLPIVLSGVAGFYIASIRYSYSIARNIVTKEDLDERVPVNGSGKEYLRKSEFNTHIDRCRKDMFELVAIKMDAIEKRLDSIERRLDNINLSMDNRK